MQVQHKNTTPKAQPGGALVIPKLVSVVNVKKAEFKREKFTKPKFSKEKANVVWWKSTDDVTIDNEKSWFQESNDELYIVNGSAKLDGQRADEVWKLVEAKYESLARKHNEDLIKSSKGNSELKWMNDMIKSGTMSDKVASLTLKVQHAPFYELDNLMILVAMLQKKESRTVQLVLQALKDLFSSNLLPDRPLRPLSQVNINHPAMNMKAALICWFESRIKHYYDQTLQSLEAGMQSNVDFFKKECLQLVGGMLVAKPEQEQRLLGMLVHKLGDPSRGACTKAIEVLKSVMKSHPAMKIVIVREVRQFLYRPNLKIRPIFNGIVLLSQVPLFDTHQHRRTGSNDAQVALQLVEGYLSLFEKTVKEEEHGSRLLSALLTGINKALPFLHSTDSLEQYVDPLFRIAHTSTSFATATQALMLLSHISMHRHDSKNGRGGHRAAPHEAEEDDEEVEESAEPQLTKRFYRALYAKLLSEQISIRTKNTLFLNLLFRSIKGDAQTNRSKAFIKRLLMCAAQSSPSIAAGLLYLVSELFKARPALKQAVSFTAPESVKEDRQSRSAEDVFFGNFNVSKREPEFAYEHQLVATGWEVALLRQHFHPSVQAFATSLGSPEAGHTIVYNGDPTLDFSLMAFLNRFAYKNPKKTLAERHAPAGAQVAVKDVPMNLAFTSGKGPADVESVAPDRQFFYKYFTDKQLLVNSGRSRDRTRSKRGEDEEGSEDESVDLDDEDGAGHSDDDEENNDGKMKLDKPKKKAGKKDLDEEAEIDRFADKLAEQLMRSAAGNMGDDADDFNEFSDDESDGASDNGSAVMGVEEDLEGSEGDSEGEGEDDLNFNEDDAEGDSADSDVDFDEAEEGSEDGSEGDDSYSGLMAYGFDDDMPAPAAAASKKGKKNGKRGDVDDYSEPVSKKKGKRSRDDDAFASAEDYEDVMEEIVGKVRTEGKEKEAQKESKSEKKNGKGKLQPESVQKNEKKNEKGKKSSESKNTKRQKLGK